jgi:hypothetical protein
MSGISSSSLLIKTLFIHAQIASFQTPSADAADKVRNSFVQALKNFIDCQKLFNFLFEFKFL